jgi:hypothetical protein
VLLSAALQDFAKFHSPQQKKSWMRCALIFSAALIIQEIEENI